MGRREPPHRSMRFPCAAKARLGRLALPAPQIAHLDQQGRPLAAGEHGEIGIARSDDRAEDMTTISPRPEWLFRDERVLPNGDLGYRMASVTFCILVASRGDQPGRTASRARRDRGRIAEPQGGGRAVAFSVPHARLGQDVAAAVVLRPGPRHGPGLRAFARRMVSQVPGAGRDRHRGRISETEVARSGAQSSPPRLPWRAQARPGASSRNGFRARNWNLNSPDWGAALELDEIGVDEDFFVLGAGSPRRHQTRLRACAKRYGAIFFKDISDAPTVTALAKRARIIASRPSSEVRLPGAMRPAKARGTRLSFQQQRIYVSSSSTRRSTITTFSKSRVSLGLSKSAPWRQPRGDLRTS